MPTFPKNFQTLAQIQEKNKDTPNNLPKNLIIAIWKSIPTGKDRHDTEVDDLNAKIVKFFITLCKADTKTANIADDFEKTAKPVSVGGVNCQTWNVNVLNNAPNQWEAWAIQVISAAI